MAGVGCCALGIVEIFVGRMRVFRLFGGSLCPGLRRFGAVVERFMGSIFGHAQAQG